MPRFEHLALKVAAICCMTVAVRVEAQSPGPYELRHDMTSARAIRDVIAISSRIPLRRTFESMLAEERTALRDFYTDMKDSDEPPFPAMGLEPLVRALHKAQSRLLVSGDLYLVADVDSNGDVQTVTAYGSPSPEMTKIAASALALQKFKPALCGGVPCSQKFPFALGFKVE